MTDSPASRIHSPHRRVGAAREQSSARAMARALFALCLLPILVAVFLLSWREPFGIQQPLHLGALAIAGLSWLAAIGIARTRAGDLRVVVVGAIALRLLALVAEPNLSDDVHRYVWEGEVVLSGESPYAHAPDAPELDELGLRFPTTRRDLNHPAISAAYPPVAQAAFAATQASVHAVAQMLEMEGGQIEPASVRGMRIVFTLADLLCLWPLVLLLRRSRLPSALAVVWGWSPLVVMEFGASAHFDSLGILLFLGALVFLTRRRASPMGEGSVTTAGGDAIGSFLLAAAILVKFLPLCIVPFVCRGKVAIRRAFVLGLSLAALGIVPFLFLPDGFRGLTSGLTEYGVRWESFNFVYSWIEAAPRSLGFELDRGVTDPRLLARGFCLMLWVAWGIWLYSRTHNVIRAASSLLALFLFLTPTLHPWYLCWLLPFLALRPRLSWLWVAFTAPALYATRFAYISGETPVQPEWLWPLIALPFLAFLAYESLDAMALHRKSEVPEFTRARRMSES